MKILASFILAVFALNFGSAQTSATAPELQKKDAPARRVFGSQGEQEDYWALQFFIEHRERQVYERFKGSIVVLNETTIKYDDKVLAFWNIAPALKPIFEKGIFYPNIITGNDKATPTKTPQELDSLTPDQKLIYNLTRTDSTRISNFEELTFMHSPPQIKRFKFYLYNYGMGNPTACFIELTNNSATEQTGLPVFIEGATLTFFKRGWHML